MTYRNFDFTLILKDNTADYVGPHMDLIKSAPSIFNLLIKLLDDSDIPNSTRSKLFTVIGYFFVEKDIYPEDEHGAIGYIDDILASLTVISEVIKIIGIEAVKSYNDDKSIDLMDLLTNKFNDAQSDYNELYNEVIDYLGF